MKWLTLFILFNVASTASGGIFAAFFLFLRIVAKIVFRCVIRSVARKPGLILKKIAKTFVKETAIDTVLDAVTGGEKRFIRDLTALQLQSGGVAGGSFKADPYLIYLSETSSGLTFYQTDFEFNNFESLLSIESQNNQVDNLFVDCQEKLLYWSYVNSTTVGFLNFTTKGNKETIKTLKGNEFATTVGLGEGDKVYLYFPTTKQLTMYDFDSGQEEKQMDGLKNVDANMNCVDVDPRYKTEIFFDDCSAGKSYGKVFDVNKNKVDETYNQALPKCFDQWRISPDAKRAYAVSNREIYLSPKEGEPFEEYYLADDEIVGFAAGNDALFFTKEVPEKIFKVTEAEASKGAEHATYLKDFPVKGTVRAMALCQ